MNALSTVCIVVIGVPPWSTYATPSSIFLKRLVGVVMGCHPFVVSLQVGKINVCVCSIEVIEHL